MVIKHRKMGKCSCAAELRKRHLCSEKVFHALAGIFREIPRLPSLTNGHGTDNARWMMEKMEEDGEHKMQNRNDGFF